jgi:hypothetical protein
LLGERRSTQDRYYYSAFDHAINPSWSPDGRALLYVGNPESRGARAICGPCRSMPAQRRKVLSEETSWNARPELAPDGKRILFSSYRGRQTHQLWLTTLQGAAPLPLTFGDTERRNARFSPDGKRIAYIGNAGADGNTQLVVMDVLGGASQVVEPRRLRPLSPTGRLTLDIRDAGGQRVPARVSVQGSDARAHAPRTAWMHADDGFDRAKLGTEAHYFHCTSPCTLDVPAGATDVIVQHGFAHDLWRQRATVVAGRDTALQATLVAQAPACDFGRFISADLHVHMNYGGHYRNTPANLARQAQAEDLDVVESLIVNKEERVPDVAYSERPVSTTRAAAHRARAGIPHQLLGPSRLLNLRDHLVTPDFSPTPHGHGESRGP